MQVILPLLNTTTLEKKSTHQDGLDHTVTKSGIQSWILSIATNKFIN